MSLFLVLGIVGLAVIVVALLAGDVLGGAFGGALDGLGGDWFSTEVVGAFVSAFGFGGAIADQLGAPAPATIVVGLVAGAVFAAAGAGLTRLVRGGATDHTPAADDAVGREGVVVSDIPDEGMGNVRVHLGGHTLRFNARADGGLAAGTRVHVTGVLSPTAVTVAPLWDALPPG